MSIRSLDMWTTNPYLKAWIQEMVQLCGPETVCFIDGTDEEAKTIEDQLVASHTFIRLNEALHHHSFLARSHPGDVARVEERTFICSKTYEEAGPTNNWKSPKEMKEALTELFTNCMRGRTMYVVPYCMGPLDSPYSKVAVQITDSPYVVASMRIMTRMGRGALDKLGHEHFVKCLHSVGQPLAHGAISDSWASSSWPCNPEKINVSHFPESKEVWSFGSGYGGNALLNKKCFALRIASKMAKEEGWLAEHMLIVGITNPQGIKHYFTGAFPSACGKTNLAMLCPNLPGWKVECVGDDIAWMHWGEDGRLYAINPEFGFFGVAPGTSDKSNPNAMGSIKKNTIFTNVALTDDGDVWWEGMSQPPEHLIDWKGRNWTPKSTEKAADANSRFTAPTSQCPVLDPLWNSPKGVPISGIIFGGKRAHTLPLVRQARSWSHGVFLGASLTSETTAAAIGVVGEVRHDPFAMRPFCGYNMGDYFGHWLAQEKDGRELPEIFHVNWFQKDSRGKFMWPGFGDNIRVLKWMFERIENKVDAQDTPIGLMPMAKDIDLTGLDVSSKTMEQLLIVDHDGWKEEAARVQHYLVGNFQDHLPAAIRKEVEALQSAFDAQGE